MLEVGKAYYPNVKSRPKRTLYPGPMTIEVLGVYQIPGHPDASLVEVTVHRRPSTVDVGAFTQEDPNSDRGNWQVPYDERFLNADGTTEIGQRWAMGWKARPGADEPQTTRLVFFFHFLTMNRPLLTPYVKASLPEAQPVPERLAFVEYEPPD